MEQLQEQEGDVLARRDLLTREREKVSADRAALDEKRKQVAAQGGDTKVVDEEEQALSAREAKLGEQESELNKKIDTLISGYQAAASPAAGPGDQMARREAAVALREKDFTRREVTVAQREASIAERERDLAKREKDTCSVGPPTIVQQTVTAPSSIGSKYSRHDVEPILQNARRKMTEKGLLPSDLPAPSKGLEKEATDAMGAGDFGKAKFAADQLYSAVDGVKVDKSFIVGKITRLSTAVRSSKLADEARQQVEELFRDATADYGDGRFGAANGKLNRIYALVQ